jgi:DNA-binding MarR family transcriptional regulator
MSYLNSDELNHLKVLPSCIAPQLDESACAAAREASAGVPSSGGIAACPRVAERKLFIELKCALASFEKADRLGGKQHERSGETAQMDKRRMPSGEKVDKRAADWRPILRRHAERILGGTLRTDPATMKYLAGALGPLADDALKIVEAYARGAALTSGGTQPPAEFANRLDIILNGIEASLGERRDAHGVEAKPHVIQSELWQILRRVRESAELSYAREQELIELDRRILFLLQSAGPLVPADISSAVGVDKAQVSRSVKRLLELGLVERGQIRAPLRLTRDGDKLMKRMLRMAELRNRELTIEIGDDELSEFYATVEVLLDRAMALYEQERELAQGGGSRGSRAEPIGKAGDGRAGERIAVDRTRIVSPLMTLSSYFSRSGALAFKRLTGLSTFEAFVLSEIGMDPPVDWSTLVHVLARDHSQAGRTVQGLIERGLVAREGKPGRRHGRFFPTGEGERLHAVIHEAGRQRSAFLLAPLPAEQRARFLGTFDKIRRNAVAQLERERAFAEIDRRR